MAVRQEKQPVARVFWPFHCNDSPPGYLIGWNIRSFIGCVACVVSTQQVQDPQELQDALTRVANEKKLHKIHKYCSGPPIILGLWNPPEEQNDQNQNNELLNDEKEEDLSLLNSFVIHKKQTENFWITMTLRSASTSQYVLRSNRREDYQFYSANHPFSSKKQKEEKLQSVPHLKELSCFGYQYVADSQVIFYKLSSNNHYFSCGSLNLDPFDENVINPTPIDDHQMQTNTLEKTLRQVNCSLIIEKEIRKAIEFGKLNKKNLANTNLDQNQEDIKQEKQENHSDLDNNTDIHQEDKIQEKKIEKHEEEEEENKIDLDNATDIHQELMKTYERKKKYQGIICKSIWYFMIFISLISISAQSLCKKLLEISPVSLIQILERSATIQQIQIRLSFVKQLPRSWNGLHENWKNHPQTRRFTINFKNSFALVILDTILGISFAILISYYADDVVSFLNRASIYFMEKIVVANIKWLMGWPAGFKLNDNVDSFMGQLFLFYSSKWTEILHTLPISYHTFIVLTSSTGVLGLSMMLSIISDLLFICSLHIHWFYNGSARIYMHQLQAISGLWKLFRGKKRNVLRNRIDSCHYDIDQLLLGTILFTVLFFLLPTVAIYYLYFSLIRFLVFCVHAIIFSALQILNHFPIYSVLLYIFDSSLFPGLYF